jgi:hypothetical protein
MVLVSWYALRNREAEVLGRTGALLINREGKMRNRGYLTIYYVVSAGLWYLLVPRILYLIKWLKL